MPASFSINSSTGSYDVKIGVGLFRDLPPDHPILADAFFQPLAGRLDALMSEYPPDLLQQFETLVTRLCSAMDAQLAQPDPGTDG